MELSEPLWSDEKNRKLRFVHLLESKNHSEAVMVYCVKACVEHF